RRFVFARTGAWRRDRERRRQGRPGHDDGPQGRVRRRRHGAFRAHGHRHLRPRQEGRPLRRRILRGGTYAPPPKHGLASFERLNAWYYEDAPGTVRPTIAAIRRVENFEEVVKGLDETNALYEARRCLSCGNCFECDNCYGVCPDNAVIKL